MEQLCASATGWQEDTEPSPALAACTASAMLGMKEESVGLAFSASGIGWEEKGAPLVTLAGGCWFVVCWARWCPRRAFLHRMP